MIKAIVSYSKLCLVIGNFTDKEVRNFAENHHTLINCCNFSNDNIYTLMRMLSEDSCSIVDIYIKEEDYKDKEIIIDKFVSIISKTKYVKLFGVK